VFNWLQVRNLLVEERGRLLEGLKKVPFLEPYPSHANFILAKVMHT
jgi:histidinol-phosphate aminotransferase